MVTGTITAAIPRTKAKINMTAFFFSLKTAKIQTKITSGKIFARTKTDKPHNNPERKKVLKLGFSAAFSDAKVAKLIKNKASESGDNMPS